MPESHTALHQSLFIQTRSCLLNTAAAPETDSCWDCDDRDFLRSRLSVSSITPSSTKRSYLLIQTRSCLLETPAAPENSAGIVTIKTLCNQDFLCRGSTPPRSSAPTGLAFLEKLLACKERRVSMDARRRWMISGEKSAATITLSAGTKAPLKRRKGAVSASHREKRMRTIEEQRWES